MKGNNAAELVGYDSNFRKDFISNQSNDEGTMTRNAILLLVLGFFLLPGISSAQQDTAATAGILSQWTAIKFKVDTTAPPNDRMTAQIHLLRAERGWFNIDNVIRLSIEGQRTKDTTHSKEYYKRLLESCEHGEVHRLIDNIFVNLYRQCFTEEEVNELVKFYKTSAGKKMGTDFIVLTITGANAANAAVKAAEEKLSLEMKKKGN